jgi:hypothetical protein
MTYPGLAERAYLSSGLGMKAGPDQPVHFFTKHQNQWSSEISTVEI